MAITVISTASIQQLVSDGCVFAEDENGRGTLTRIQQEGNKKQKKKTTIQQLK